MSDRLKDLQRQRALAQEQLAGIDREIAKETGQGSATSAPVVPPAPAAARSAGAVEAARMAEEILAKYQREGGDTDSTQRHVKRGCFLYFGLAFVLLALGVAALYFYSTGRR
jgi:hypothetical protein